MIECLSETSSFMKYSEGQCFMKYFLENIFAKIWDSPAVEQEDNNDNMFYFLNYLNIPCIFATFYKGYI